ncbi:unnamed protein product [Brassica oleracea var. botrytis]
MASGWGITGNKGRCYDFWMDFSECMSHCREPKDCSLLREDYLECLHHSKEVHALLTFLSLGVCDFVVVPTKKQDTGGDATNTSNH